MNDQNLEQRLRRLGISDAGERTDLTGRAAGLRARATRRRTRRRQVVAIAAIPVVVLLAVVAFAAMADEPTEVIQIGPGPASTSPDQPTTTSLPPYWPGPGRERSALVQRMAAERPASESFTWQDPLDAPVGWADVTRVALSPIGQAHWFIELAAKPPLTADLEPGLLIAYGLVLETTGDGVGDYLVGIDNDAPRRGDLHVWVTDLATGDTDEQIGPPYGFPIEFKHPDEDDPPNSPTMTFTFLGSSGPDDLNPETVRFYAWTAATRNGEVVANDYAPDTGWITSDAP